MLKKIMTQGVFSSKLCWQQVLFDFKKTGLSSDLRYASVMCTGLHWSGATGSNHDQRDWGRIGHTLKDQGWNLLRLCCFEKSPAQVDSGDLFDIYFPMNPSPIRILLDRPWTSLRFGEPLPKHWSLQDIPFCFFLSVLLIQRIQLSKMGYKTNNSHNHKKSSTTRAAFQMASVHICAQSSPSRQRSAPAFMGGTRPVVPRWADVRPWLSGLYGHVQINLVLSFWAWYDNASFCNILQYSACRMLQVQEPVWVWVSRVRWPWVKHHERCPCQASAWKRKEWRWCGHCSLVVDVMLH